MTVRLPERPICDHGRCAQVLDLLAQREVELPERLGAMCADVITATLRDLGHDPDAVHVRAVVVRHLVIASGEVTLSG